MKVAVIGSRGLSVPHLEEFLPPDTTEIVSGGARGIDTDARAYAHAHGLILTEFLPEYARYGRGAPLLRNREIVRYSDMVLAFWDGISSGTRYVIEQCLQQEKPLHLFLENDGTFLPVPPPEKTDR